MTEHEAQGSFQHRFVGLLKTSLFVESENLLCGGKFLLGVTAGSVQSAPNQPFVV
jgi:hypothetical protein